MDDQLDHLGYELEMSVACAVRYPGAHQAGDVVVANALLEAHLLHARSLIEFLIRDDDRKRPRDLRRTAFLDPDWIPTPSDAATRLGGYYTGLSRRLVHLTMTRLEPLEEGWPYLRMARDLLDVSSAWRDALRPHRSAAAVVLTSYIERSNGLLIDAVEVSAGPSGPPGSFGATGATGPAGPTSSLSRQQPFG